MVSGNYFREEKLEILHDWVYQDRRVGLQVPDFIMFSIIKSSDRFLKTDWKICFVFLVSNLVILSPHEISSSEFPAAPCPGPNQFKFMILEWWLMRCITTLGQIFQKSHPIFGLILDQCLQNILKIFPHDNLMSFSVNMYQINSSLVSLHNLNASW